jgi:hypothetical protein
VENSTNSYGVRLAKIFAPTPSAIIAASPATISRFIASSIVSITADTSNGKS